MKVTIITDAAGKVMGTVHSAGPAPEGAPTEVRIVPAPGQTVSEIELPTELERVESPTQLYAILAQSYVVDIRTATLTRTKPQEAD